ncbi:thiol reductant ABC exporter subunit CydC [Cryptosporangium sp. NPDC048952]|uniref:thiol reductant ABC exporter subunit CydC n=1 Tax=Cryptosporangium sp. NPDC048952 TaxID=3363961 RepID=UPI003715996C
MLPASGRLILAGGLGAGALGCAVALSATSGWLISRASQQPPVLELAVAVTAVRAFGIGRGLLRYVERLVGHDATFRILAALRSRVYARLERLGPAALPTFRRGDLLARFVSDVDQIQDRYLRVRLPFAIAVVVGVLSTLGATALLPTAGLALGVALLIGGALVPWLTIRTAERAERETVADRAALTTSVVELLQAAPELIAHGAAEPRLRALDELDRRLERSAAHSAWATGLASALTALATGGAVLAALAAGTSAVEAGRLDPVLLAVVVLLPLAAFEAVTGLPVAARSLVRVRKSGARLAEIFDAESPVAPGTERVHAVFPLVLSGVGARWPGASECALTDVDLRVDAGRRIAVVGASGAGKSTLAALLVRFLDPAAGTFTLAGRPVANFDPDAVRELIGWCAQDAHLFDTSIRNNLRVARPAASEPELFAALDAARLADWVRSLPAGLDTPVGERGTQVSGGQRQRLALARVVLADFPVVVLDEPTANLEPPTADALTRDLLAATEGRATVLITHRLAGCEHADEIVVLEAGRIVQRGTHDALLAVDGPYRIGWERERRDDSRFGAVEPERVGD